MNNDKPSAIMTELADRLYDSGLPSNFGAKDVLIWYSDHDISVAFKGDALRMERASFSNKIVTNRRGEKEEHFETPGNARRIRDILVSSLGIKSTIYVDNDYEHITHIRDVIQGALSDFLQSNGVDSEVFWTLMPNEGEPWNEGDSFTYYYSAAKRKVLKGYPPKDTYKVQLDEGEATAANICTIVPTFVAEKSALVGVLSSGYNIFASHTFSVSLFQKESAKSIKDCGGLVFPSLALGPVAANTFGKITLVSNLEFALSSMRPYKTKKGAWQVTVYDTDAWTGRTSTFVSEGASDLFEQLTGNWQIPSYSYQLHFWTLGPPITEGPTDASIIPSTKRMQSIINKRMKIWNRAAKDSELSLSSMDRMKDSYPYLEVKVNGVYSISSFPLAVVEKAELSQSVKILKSIGWSGDLIVIDDESGTYKVKEPEVDSGLFKVLKYSWLVNDAVSYYAEKNGLIERIVV